MAGENNFGKVPMSVCVIKPDAVQGGIMQEILSELEKRGFILLQQDMQMMTTTKARALYLEHEKADFFKSLIGFMTSGPINAVLLTHSSSPDPVTELQGTVGPTNSEKARADAPERCEARLLAALASCMDFPLTDICACLDVVGLCSLRAMFGTDGMRNAVHAPANQAAAVNAIKTFFPLGARDSYPHLGSAWGHLIACSQRSRRMERTRRPPNSPQTSWSKLSQLGSQSCAE